MPTMQRDLIYVNLLLDCELCRNLYLCVSSLCSKLFWQYIVNGCVCDLSICAHVSVFADWVLVELQECIRPSVRLSGTALVFIVSHQHWMCDMQLYGFYVPFDPQLSKSEILCGRVESHSFPQKDDLYKIISWILCPLFLDGIFWQKSKWGQRNEVLS